MGDKEHSQKWPTFKARVDNWYDLNTWYRMTFSVSTPANVCVRFTGKGNSSHLLLTIFSEQFWPQGSCLHLPFTFMGARLMFRWIYANPPLHAKRYASLVRLHNATSATPQSCLCWENHPPPYIHICMCLWNIYCDITRIYKYPDMTTQTFNVSHPFYIEPSSRLTRSISHCHR